MAESPAALRQKHPNVAAAVSAGSSRARSWLFAGLGLAMLLAAPDVGALTKTPIGTSGGNPGGQTLWEVGGALEGDSFELFWVLDGSGAPFFGDLPDLSAAGTVTVARLSATQAILDITLANTTAPAPSLDAPITVFGLEVDGFMSGELSQPGTHLDRYDTGDLAGELTAEFCASTNSACNWGQPMQGIPILGSDSFSFTLMGNFDTANGLTLRNFGTKWQTNYDDIVPNPRNVPKGDNSSFELPGQAVPEPSSVILLGFGLAGIVLVRHRRAH